MKRKTATKLWRIHLKPRTNSFDHCLHKEVVGIGWAVSPKPSRWEEYLKLGESKYGDKGWRRATNAVVKPDGMQIDDLVWSRNMNGDYYVGRIESEWKYCDDPDSLSADIVNVRRCKLRYVGKQVIGKIVDSFRAGATVQQIHDDTALLFSKSMFNKVANEHLLLEDLGDVDLFSLLTADGLEDVVGLYLQSLKGLRMVPSSCKSHSIAFEYMLVDPNSERSAYVQVKGGNVQLDPADYYKEHPNTDIYLFSPSGYKRESTAAHVICLTKEEIMKFVEITKSIMPPNVSWAVWWWCRLRKP